MQPCSHAAMQPCSHARTEEACSNRSRKLVLDIARAVLFSRREIDDRRMVAPRPNSCTVDGPGTSSIDLPINGGVLHMTGLSRSLQNTLEALMSFKDCEHLLRATNLAVALHGGGRILGSATGSDKTYDLSRSTDSIDIFLSHNWSTPRPAKFLSLVYEYNYDIAIGVMLVVSALVTVGSCYSDILEIPDMTIDSTLDIEMSIAIGCKVFSVPVFLLVILFCRDATKRVGMPGPSLFLDKCCIDQVVPEIQQCGIRKLGAFLAMSRNMLVLYSDTYLQKLWTIYEMASFLAIHDVESLKIVPVLKPQLFFTLVVFWWFYRLVLGIVRITQSFHDYGYIVCCMGSYLAMMCLRSWVRHKSAIRNRVETFEVETSKCANEADRPLVYHNIQCLMEGARLVEPGCPLEEALTAFNQLVRTTLPYAFVDMVGARAFRFRDYLLFGFVVDGVQALDWGATLVYRGLPLHVIFPETLYHILWVASWPIALVVAEVVCSFNLHLRGWREKVMVLTWLVLLALCLFIINQLEEYIKMQARDSDLALVLLVGMTLAAWLLCVALCRGHKAALPTPSLRSFRLSQIQSRASTTSPAVAAAAEAEEEEEEEEEKKHWKVMTTVSSMDIEMGHPLAEAEAKLEEASDDVKTVANSDDESDAN